MFEMDLVIRLQKKVIREEIDKEIIFNDYIIDTENVSNIIGDELTNTDPCPCSYSWSVCALK